jgi:predicted component of type VI protein secretion system
VVITNREEPTEKQYHWRADHRRYFLANLGFKIGDEVVKEVQKASYCTKVFGLDLGQVFDRLQQVQI